MAADAPAAAALLRRAGPGALAAALGALESQPRAAFELLRAAFALEERARAEALLGGGGGGGSAAASPTAAHRRPQPRSPQAQGQAQGQQGPGELEQPGVVDRYLRLLCQFAPSEALPFLQGGAHAYDVRAAIAACAGAGATDAEAFLHERLGDLEAALRLHLRELALRNDGLEAALREGRAPALEAPPQLAAALGGGGGGDAAAAGALAPREAAVAMALWLRRRLGLPTAPAAAVYGRPPPTRLPSQGGAAGDGGAREPLKAQQAPGQLAGQAQAREEQQQPEPTAAQRRKASLAASKARQAAAAAAAHALASAGSFDLDGGAAAAAAACPELAAALAAARQVRGDAHLAWIAALSPRARLHGAAPDGGGGGGAPPAPPPPPEAAAAWRAMAAAVAFCTRASRDAAPRRPAAAAATAAAAAAASDGADGGGGGAYAPWFGVLDAYTSRLRRLKLQRDASGGSGKGFGGGGGGGGARGRWWSPDAELQCALEGLEAALSAAAAAAADGAAAPPTAASAAEGGLAAALAAARAALLRRAARDAYAALTDDVVSRMADHVPLRAIVTRVLERHSQEALGEFRPTLLGLFGAHAYERAILGAAGRLVGRDAFTAVAEARALRAGAAAAAVAGAGEDAGEGGSSEGEGGGGGDFSGGGIGGGALAAAAAHHLGVLGAGRRARERSGGAQERGAPGEREQLVGLLLGGSAGLGLRLRPPAAAAPPGAPGGGMFAAAAGGLEGGPFAGGCDIALEIAALHPGPASPAARSGGGGGGAQGDAFDIDAMLEFALGGE